MIRDFNFRVRIKSFVHAFNGIKLMIIGEHNFLIHTLSALLAIVAGIILKISTTEWCLVVVVSGMVFTAETFNSSVERLSDFVHPDKHEKIKAVKDLAAAAVLFSAIAAFIVGILVFLPKIILFAKALL